MVCRNRIAVLVGLVATLAALSAAGSAAAAPFGCYLTGNAGFTPGLKASGNPTSDTFKFSLHGYLSFCYPVGPTGGSVTSGEPIVEDGVTYRPDYQNTGTGGCDGSTASGTAVFSWNNSTVSVVSFTWVQVTGGAMLRGNIIPSASYTGTKVVNGENVEVHKVFTTTTGPAGGLASGGISFPATNGLDCMGAGLTTAPVQGGFGLNP